MSSPPKLQEPILAPGELPAPRPPMSYAALIGEALLMAPPPHQLYVSEISDSIKKRYAYYRQNPTKIYNGVRHQTSMCKAFVKLPRPFGDQSGGARKWAIRAGCETWFSNGGYNPPGYHGAAKRPISSSGPGGSMGGAGSAMGGKAKSTARSKQLAIGTGIGLTSPRSSPYGSPGNAGPSVGPAYDGTSKPYYPPQYPLSGYAAPPPPPSQYLPPGYHYVPVPAAQGHPNGSQAMYVPVWNPYSSTSSSSTTGGNGGNGNGNGNNGGATPSQSQMSQGHLQQPPTPASSYHTMGIQGSWGPRYGVDEKGSPESYDEHIQGRMSPTSAHGSDQ